MSGEENSDEIRKGSGKIKFKSNQAGGILEVFHLVKIFASFAVKPTSSILTSRDTIDKKGKNTKISVKADIPLCWNKSCSYRGNDQLRFVRSLFNA